MLNEYKKPMWNDGFAKDMPWLNYFNEYERTHCCFNGDGADSTDTSSDPFDIDYEGTGQRTASDKSVTDATHGLEEDKQGYGENTGMTNAQAEAANAAAAAAAAEAAAAGGSEEQQASARQAAVDISTAESLGMDIGDIDGGIGLSIEEIEGLYDLDHIGHNALVDLGYFDKVDKSFALDDARQAAQLTADLRDQGLKDINVTVGPDGTWSYEGKDAWSAFGGQLSKGIGDIASGLAGQIGGLASAFTQLGPGALFGHALDVDMPSILDPAGIGPGVRADWQGMLGDVSTALGGTPQSTLSHKGDANQGLSAGAGIGEFEPSALQTAAALGGLNSLVGESAPRSSLDAQIAADYTKGIGRGDAVTQSKLGLSPAYEQELQRREIEEERKAANIYKDDRWKDWHGLHLATGGQVGEEEEKTKSAMELYLEKLGQPSKYTVPTVPMDTPSMAPPPAGSDPFELAEYRKGLARETMGNYLPFDVGGASGALNTFNEDYYGGASNVSPYNMAQLASILGLRGPGSYEGIIGMLGGVRNEPPPPPPEPDPEPEPPVTPDDPYDDEGGPGPDEDDPEGWGSDFGDTIDQELTDDWDDDPDAMFAGGGGIGRVLRRQAGGMTTHEGLQGFGMQSPRPFGITSFGSGLR